MLEILSFRTGILLGACWVPFWRYFLLLLFFYYYLLHSTHDRTFRVFATATTTLPQWSEACVRSLWRSYTQRRFSSALWEANCHRPGVLGHFPFWSWACLLLRYALGSLSARGSEVWIRPRRRYCVRVYSTGLLYMMFSRDSAPRMCTVVFA